MQWMKSRTDLRNTQVFYGESQGLQGGEKREKPNFHVVHQEIMRAHIFSLIIKGKCYFWYGRGQQPLGYKPINYFNKHSTRQKLLFQMLLCLTATQYYTVQSSISKYILIALFWKKTLNIDDGTINGTSSCIVIWIKSHKILV